MELVEASSLRPLQRLEEARSFTHNDTLNGPGSLNWSINIEAEEAYDIEALSTAVIAYRNGEAEFGGRVMTIEEGDDDGTVAVGNIGWFEELEHRLVEPDQVASLDFTSATDIGTIALMLLAAANAKGPVLPGAVSSTMIIPGQHHYSFALPEKSYEAYAEIAREIKLLADLENGFDFRVHPVARTLDIFHPRLGEVKPDIELGLRVSVGGLALFGRKTDGTVVKNDVYVFGASGDPGHASDSESQAKYGLRQARLAQINTIDQDMLGAYANAELAYFANPQTTFNVRPLPAASGDPQPYDDYRVGDTIYVSADWGRLQVRRQAVRIFGMNVSVDEEGNERVNSLRVTYA